MDLNSSQVVLEEKKGLKSGEASQLILTLYCLISSLLIKSNYFECNWEHKIWVEFMFFGNLIWLVYLLIMTVTKYKDRVVRKFFTIIDCFIFFFHLAMWIWLFIIYSKDQLFKKCDASVDLFSKVYLILGLIGFIIIGVGIFGSIFKIIKGKNHNDLGINGQILSQVDYMKDNSNFNAYN